MRSPLSLRCGALGAAILLVAATARAQNPSCWNPAIGPDLQLGDDELATGLALPFAFPLPGGGTTNALDVSSNGFVWLVSGSSTSEGCCDGDPTALVAEPQRIAPVWMDLDPSSGGSVHFAATATEAVITWNGVPEYADGGANTVQLQLFPQGAFQISIRELTDPGSHDLLIGVSNGGGATDPGEFDLSTLPYQSGGVATAYELFSNGTDVRDVVGKSFLFLPDGSGGYMVVDYGPCAAFATYGAGCPGSVSAAAYEFFDVTGANEIVDLTNTFAMELVPAANGGVTFRTCTNACWESNFGTDLGLDDDDLSGALTLGFTSAYGSVVTSAVRVSSNGFVYLQDGSDDGCCDGDVFSFLADEPRVAALWNDMDPSSGGQVAFATFPGRAVVTWDQVPEYGTSNSNTFQVQFFSNGKIVMAWQQTQITNHDVLVGFSGGRGATDPGESDFTANLPFTSNGASTPLTLAAAAGTGPVLGTNFAMGVGGLPSTSPFGAVLLGFTNPGLPLDPIGMPGCTLLSDGVASVPFTPNGLPAVTVTLPIPATASLAGINLLAQGVAFAPGVNGLGVIASNGGRLLLGF